MDPNKAYVPYDPWYDQDEAALQHRRTRAVQRTVRRSLSVLNAPERAVIEGYYFDGLSLPQLANQAGVPLIRIRVMHRRALGKLRQELTPFVIAMYGLRLSHDSDCPICTAPWRDAAERILDDKTADMTWGDVAVRIERAVGWTCPTPQVLMTHQRKHRHFQRRPKGDIL
ncbi:MAG: hypothetical protein Kow0074_16380 [Candidatus Zixiibacteriota bacterium]